MTDEGNSRQLAATSQPVAPLTMPPDRAVAPSPATPQEKERSSAAIESVATLVDEQAARWNTRPASLVALQSLQLTSGSVTLRMGEGAEVTLWGACRFELESPRLLRLQSGRLHAVVPPAAVGFTVLTPSSRVVDLGTVFDVTVDEEGASGLQVQQGLVEMTAVGDEDRQWRLTDGFTRWLTADGDDFDWLMLIRAHRGSVSLEVDGGRMAYMGSAQQAHVWMLREFNALHRRLPTRVNPSNPFRALVDVNGHAIQIRTQAELKIAQQDILRQLAEWERAQDGVPGIPSFSPNFLPFDFDRMRQQLKDLRDEAMRKTPGLGDSIDK